MPSPPCGRWMAEPATTSMECRNTVFSAANSGHPSDDEELSSSWRWMKKPASRLHNQSVNGQSSEFRMRRRSHSMSSVEHERVPSFPESIDRRVARISRGKERRGHFPCPIFKLGRIMFRLRGPGYIVCYLQSEERSTDGSSLDLKSMLTKKIFHFHLHPSLIFNSCPSKLQSNDRTIEISTI